MGYQIRGKVIDRRKRKHVPGVRVEAWDKGNVLGDYLGYAATSRDGSFVINLEETLVRDLFPQRLPATYFKVWCGDQLLASTEDSVVWYPNDPKALHTIVVDSIKPMKCGVRHIYLKIERLDGYSPVKPLEEEGAGKVRTRLHAQQGSRRRKDPARRDSGALA